MNKTYRIPVEQYPSMRYWSRKGVIIVNAAAFDAARKMCREEIRDMRHALAGAHQFICAAYALADYIGHTEGFAAPSPAYQAVLDAEAARIEKMMAQPINVHDNSEYLS